jgi:hypothetical protein
MTTAAPSTTSTLRTTGRRWVFWMIVAAVVLLAAVVTLVTSSTTAGGARLDPLNPAPDGAMAVAEVLRTQGVEVVVVTTSDDALDELGSTFGTTSDRAAESTLLVHDPDGLLSDDRLETLAGAAETTVLLEPGYRELDAFAPGVEPAGVVDGTAHAECSLPVADRAGEVVGEDATYRILDEAQDAAVGCFGDDDDRYRLVGVTTASGTVSVLGATTALTNEAATAAGNGALALGLLGQQPRLIWLAPTLAELAGETPPTMGELSPEWVVPFALLAVLTVIAAAVVQGRRMGPLVIEPLPVTVPSSETMRGRARLYGASRARLRAADALRLGAIGRLARDTGLATTATVDEVVASVAAVTTSPIAGIRDLLVDRVPGTDRELVELSDALLRLERDVHASVRP